MTDIQWDSGDLFYPISPGHARGSYTSLLAARSMDTDAATLRAMALNVLRSQGPKTADEIAEVLGRTVLAIRPRVTELKKLGLVEATTNRRRNVSGRSAAVVRACEPEQ